MYSGIGANVCPVCDQHMTGEGRGVGHDYVVANQTVMRYVRLGHEETIITNTGNAAATCGAPVNGDEFADASSAPDFCLSLLSCEFEILGRQPNRNKRKDV